MAEREPGGAWYAKTRIDTAKGERWFCTEAKARAAGLEAGEAVMSPGLTPVGVGAEGRLTRLFVVSQPCSASARFVFRQRWG